MSVAGPSQSSASFRTGHLNLDTFSPVNEHGSFEFDRVLKRGKVFGKIKSRHVSVNKEISSDLYLTPILIIQNRHSKLPGNHAT
jgi:hypothetical protein